MKQEDEQCRYCGAPIRRIKARNRKTVPVDAEEIWIRLDPRGETYLTEDGTFVWGAPAGDADDDPDSNLIRAFEPHKGQCPGGGGGRRRKSERKRRP